MRKRQAKLVFCFWALFMRIQPKAEHRNTKPDGRDSKNLGAEINPSITAKL
jgi:hypothetical protein